MTEENEWIEFSLDDIKVDEDGCPYVTVEPSFRFDVLIHKKGSKTIPVNMMPDSEDWVDGLGLDLIIQACRQGFKRNHSSEQKPVSREEVKKKLVTWAKFWMQTFLGLQNARPYFTVTPEQYEEIMSRKED